MQRQEANWKHIIPYYLEIFNVGTAANFTNSTIANCVITDTSLPNELSNLYPIVDFISADFANYTDDDFMINAGSPAHGYGLNILWNANSNNITTDMIGNPRIYDETDNVDRIDIGCYELQISKPVCYIEENPGVYYEALSDAFDVVAVDQTIRVLIGTHSGPWNRGITWPNVDNVTLRGVSSADSILDATAITRHFRFDYAQDHTIKDISLIDGYSDQNGGSIYISVSDNAFMLEVDSVVLSGNEAGRGGAIGQNANSYSLVSMNASKVYGNTAVNDGGGFYYGTNAISSSNVYNNTADTGGGGFAWGTNTISNSKVYANIATYGGGFFVRNKYLSK